MTSRRASSLPCIEVLGLAGQAGWLAPAAAELLAQADVLAGAARLLEEFGRFPGQKLPIKAPLDGFLAKLRELRNKGRKIVLICGGDPLYYGIGEALLGQFSPDELNFIPAPTAMAQAAARLKRPWKDWPVVSLHGRADFAPLYSCLQIHGRAALYTDRKNNPALVARTLLELAGPDYTLHVLENLGAADERTGQYTLEAVAKAEFSELNVVWIERTREPELKLGFGLDDAIFAKGGAPYTKAPVRAVSLSCLGIEPDSLVWDLGSGSGALALEAAHLACRGRVLAVEKESGRAARIAELVKKFQALCLDVVCGRMPDCLCGLPRPQRIFLGGGLSGGDEILRQACQALLPGGRIVINTVLLASLGRARECLSDLGLASELLQVQVAQDSPLAGEARLVAHNPVFVLSAQKPLG